MAEIILNWDNSAVNASPNATAQRASKRLKAVGGAFDTVNFVPANDLPKSATTTTATVLGNRVYEFKIEAICGSGGPTANNNGLQEGISFVCIVPAFSSTHNSVNVTTNLINTDITKIRFILKKASDDSIVGNITSNNVLNSATANFTGLTPGTNYYVTIELYAIVNGVEVISSASNYLNDICGGNIAGYQVATGAAPSCPAPIDLVVGITP